jgi:hypothetical protein
MKKIMFSDRFGLTQAVIDGTKTMTRRFVPKSLAGLVEAMSKPLLFIPERIIPKDMSSEAFVAEIQKTGITMYRDKGVVEIKNVKAQADLFLKAQYKLGEEVAIAQCYETLANSRYCSELGMMDTPTTFKKEFCGNGWGNKMFVKAEYMPHRIRITRVRIERLQDISEEDCMREGISRCVIDMKMFARPVTCYTFDGDPNPMPAYKTPKEAFAALIDKISGKGTWGRNPWVYAYRFELVK